MTFRRPFVAALLALALGAVGCGKKEPTGPTGPTATVVEDDVAKLVAQDAFAMLRIASLDSLQSEVRTIVGLFDPEAAAQVNLDEMLQSEQFPAVLRENLDRKRPIFGVAWFPQGSDSPSVEVLLPVADSKVVVEKLGSAHVTGEGKYVALPMPGSSKPAARGGAAIAKQTPSGDLGVRVDLARVVAKFRPVIDRELFGKMEAGGYAAMPPSAAAALKPMVEFAKGALDSAEWLDVAANVDGTRVDFDVEFRVKEGSALVGKFEGSGNLAALAGRLPNKEFPVAMLLAADMAAFAKWGQTLMEGMASALPADQRDAFLATMRASSDAYQHLGREHVFAFGLGAEGVEGVTLSSAKDAKAYVAKSLEVAKSSAAATEAMGVRMQPQPSYTVDGIEVTPMRLDLDFSKMSAGGPGMPPEAMQQVNGILQTLFGPEGLRTHTAAVDGVVVAAIGSQGFATQAVQAAKKGGKAPGALAESIRRAGGKPSFVFHLEGRALAKQIADMAKKIAPPEAKIPTVPDGKPALVVAHVTGDGRVYRGGLSAELGAIAELYHAIRTQMEGARTPPGDDMPPPGGDDDGPGDGD